MVSHLIRLTRCHLRYQTALLIAFAMFAGTASAQVQLYEQTLTVASFGGGYTKSQMLAYVRPWEAATGKAVNMVDYGGGLSEIKSQVDSANVKWDVVDLEQEDIILACRSGLLEPTDMSLFDSAENGIPVDQDIPAEYMQECGYPSVVWSTVLAYNEAAFPDDKPSTVQDFFDVKKFPGKRGLRKSPKGLLEWALIADGVAPSDVYSVLSTPWGVEQAFDSASRIKSDIVWWTSGHEPAEMLSRGTVSMSSAWNGRLYDPIVEDKLPINIIWDAQMLEIEYWAIVKDSPRHANARDFVQFALQTENMANQTKYISYGPVRKSAQDLVSDEITPYLPTSNLDNVVRVDSQWWANNITHINTAFEQWLKPKTNELDRAVRF